LSGNSGVEFVKKLFQEEQSQQDFIIDTLVNNAGYGTYGTLEDTSLERQLGMIDLNVYTLTGICYAALPYLQKGSLVINVASLASFAPLGNFAVYGATKAFVYSFSLALAAELEPKGIFVETLCPGPVDTEFANVASNGVRKNVKGGIEPDVVVKHCLKRAFKGKKIAMYRFKWKFTAILGRFVGRYLVARYTYKYNKRPYKYD
jgi:short-subunit dehydrogenase